MENWGPEGVSDGRGQYLSGHRTGRYSIWLGTHGSLVRSGDGRQGLWNSWIICRMNMSVMCFSWSMCLLFTWAAPRGPGSQKVKNFYSKVSWTSFALSAWIHTSPYSQPSLFPSHIFYPGHRFIPCLLTDGLQTRKLAPWSHLRSFIHSISSCWWLAGPVGTISSTGKDPNVDENPTLKELMVWERKRAGQR